MNDAADHLIKWPADHRLGTAELDKCHYDTVLPIETKERYSVLNLRLKAMFAKKKCFLWTTAPLRSSYSIKFGIRVQV
jgi:hypothetical protein